MILSGGQSIPMILRSNSKKLLWEIAGQKLLWEVNVNWIFVGPRVRYPGSAAAGPDLPSRGGPPRSLRFTALSPLTVFFERYRKKYSAARGKDVARLTFPPHSSRPVISGISEPILFSTISPIFT